MPTEDAIRRWPVTVDVVLAGSAFGIARGLAYDLARRGEFPVPCGELAPAIGWSRRTSSLTSDSHPTSDNHESQANRDDLDQVV